MADETQVSELRDLYPGTRVLPEGGAEYLHIPGIKITFNKTTYTVDGLLCITGHNGYPTRLFLSQQIPAPLNWNSSISVLDCTWFTWSWSEVPASMRLIEILGAHLRAFQ